MESWKQWPPCGDVRIKGMRELSREEAAEVALTLGVEMFCRRELECKLAAARRVAEEAMKMLTPDQLAELKNKLDVLESDGTL
jgi:hypothetical protein